MGGPPPRAAAPPPERAVCVYQEVCCSRGASASRFLGYRRSRRCRRSRRHRRWRRLGPASAPAASPPRVPFMQRGLCVGVGPPPPRQCRPRPPPRLAVHPVRLCRPPTRAPDDTRGGATRRRPPLRVHAVRRRGRPSAVPVDHTLRGRAPRAAGARAAATLRVSAWVRDGVCGAVGPDAPHWAAAFRRGGGGEGGGARCGIAGTSVGGGGAAGFVG